MVLFEPSEERRRRKEKLTAYMVVLAIIAIAIFPLARFYNYIQIFYLVMFTEFVYTLLWHYEHLVIDWNIHRYLPYHVLVLFFALRDNRHILL